MGNAPLTVPAAPQLKPEERRLLLVCARAAIENAVTGDPASNRPERPQPAQEKTPLSAGNSPALAEPARVFVSVYHGESLRGCIGLVRAARPLREAVVKMAVSAATQDPRFPPMTVTELAELGIEISVLGPFVPIPPARRNAGTSFLTTGEHGVHLELNEKGALFLPQVATKFGWEANEFLDRLATKAELEPEAWRHPDATLEIFRVSSFSATP